MAPKKKKVRNLTKFVHGDEPLVKNANKIQTIEMLNWYAAVSQPEDRVSWAEAYLKGHNLHKYIEAVKKNERFMIPTALHLMRALDHGSTFRDMPAVNKVIMAALEKALSVLDEKATEVKASSDAKKAKEAEQFWKIQDLVDGILSGQNLIPDNPGVRLIGNMKSHFRDQLAELEDIPTSDDLQEAYRSIDESRINSAKQFLRDILEKDKIAPAAVVRIRKPRYIPPLKKIAHLKYQKEWEGLKSANPIKILEANLMFVYNTKNHRLAMFRSSGHFDVKGNKILGWDSCVSRTLRKPLEHLQSLMNTSPMAAVRMFEDLKTKAREGYVPMRPTTLIAKVK